MAGRGESSRLLMINELDTSKDDIVELFISTDDRYGIKVFRFVCLILGPAVMIPFMFGIINDGNLQTSRCAGVTIWMAIWWMSEAVNITITALLPLVLFPLLGLLSPTAVAKSYFSDLSFLLVGTVTQKICFSISMAKWNLHKRFALKILTIVGTNPSAVLFGFMFCTYFISWWLQNTATTVMMIPVARAVLSSIQQSGDQGSKMRLLQPHEPNKGDMYKFSTAILLAVAYSASIGGIATLTGTGTNLVFAAQVRNLFPNYGEVAFAQWMAYCVPLSFFLLLVMWVIFYIKYTRGISVHIDRTYIRKKYREMGPITFEEATVGLLLLFTIALWILRNPPGCSENQSCGWEHWFHFYQELYPANSVVMSDTTTVLFTSLFLFFIPSKAKPRSKLLSWEEVQEGIPWEILLLIGSGLALAEAFSVNQFNDFVASKLTGLDGMSPYLIVFLICLSITTLTEFTSNTAVASITLPVLASVAVAIRVHPFFLMLPTVISCSFAFCLPVATPPNAMVANSGGVKVHGIFMNLGAVLLNVVWLIIGKGILGIDLNKFPDWAEPS